MLLFTLIALIVASAIVLTLALAASASPVRVDASLGQGDDDELVKPINMRSTPKPKPFVTSHQGLTKESLPLVSAAGMQ